MVSSRLVSIVLLTALFAGTHAEPGAGNTPGAAALAGQTEVSAAGIRVLRPEAGAFDECWECRPCELYTKHLNPLSGTADEGYLAPHQECIQPQYCEGGHPTCSGFALNAEDAAARILAGEGPEVVELLRAHADEMYFNVDRGAIQLLGCKGELRAHIPLSAAQTEYVRQTLATDQH